MEQYTPESAERQLERAFNKAIAETAVAEIAAEFDRKASRELSEALEQTKLFLMGELHGVEENPNIIYTLFKKFGFNNLALEWNAKLETAVQDFLATGTLDFDSVKTECDGRVTAGHLALLKKLKEEGLLEEVICFDTDWYDSSFDVRDAGMARNILAKRAEARTLVVAGNLHVKTEMVDLHDGTQGYPMGKTIREQVPQVPIGEIKYLSGEHYNVGLKQLGTMSGVETRQVRFYKAPDGRYVFELPEAHAAVVPNPRVREA